MGTYAEVTLADVESELLPGETEGGSLSKLNRKTEKIQGARKTSGRWYTDPAGGVAVELVVVSWIDVLRL